MAAPNLLLPSLITGKTVGASLGTTSVTDVLVNSAASGKVFKINCAYAVNISDSTAVSISLSFYDASQSTSYKISYKVEIPVGSSLVLIEKLGPIYLEEGDKLTAQASSASNAELVVSFEEIS